MELLVDAINVQKREDPTVHETGELTSRAVKRKNRIGEKSNPPPTPKNPAIIPAITPKISSRINI
jgi:hypothetical protein